MSVHCSKKKELLEGCVGNERVALSAIACKVYMRECGVTVGGHERFQARKHEYASGRNAKACNKSRLIK